MLAVEGLVVELGGRRVLDGVSVEVPRGELHVVLGPNGAGKTTLVRAVAGLVRPSAGRVVVGGRDVTLEPPGSRGVGVVLQGAPLLPLRTVLDHVAFPLESRGLPRGEARRVASEIAAELGLGGLLGERLSRLSGGMRQRVALATALAVSRAVLVLDEAFSSLDPAFRLDTYRLLLRLRLGGASILATTHIVDDLVLLADRVWVLVDGRVVESGRPLEIAAAPGHPYTRAALRHLAGAWLQATARPGGRHRVLAVFEAGGVRVAAVDTGDGIVYAEASEGVEEGGLVEVGRRG